MDFDEAIEESIKSFYSGKPFKAMEELKGEPLKYTLDYFEKIDVDKIKENPEEFKESVEDVSDEKTD